MAESVPDHLGKLQEQRPADARMATAPNLGASRFCRQRSPQGRRQASQATADGIDGTGISAGAEGGGLMKNISPVLVSPTVTVWKFPTVEAISRCGFPPLLSWCVFPHYYLYLGEEERSEPAEHTPGWKLRDARETLRTEARRRRALPSCAVASRRVGRGTS